MTQYFLQALCDIKPTVSEHLYRCVIIAFCTLQVVSFKKTISTFYDSYKPSHHRYICVHRVASKPPRQSWFHTIEIGLQQLMPHSGWKWLQDHSKWHQLMKTAMPSHQMIIIVTTLVNKL